MTTAVKPPPGNIDAIVSPSRLAHIVLRTSKLAEMLAWYKLVLNATAAFESEGIAFLAYDDEHHRIAFITVPDLAPQAKGASALHHFAFTYDSIRDLLGNYARLRDHGIVPTWGINHGPTTSLYYGDPEGNYIECQVDNFPTVEEAGRFFFTKHFEDNPLGVDFDPEDLHRRMVAGEDEASLKAYHAIGVRAVLDSPI